MNSVKILYGSLLCFALCASLALYKRAYIASCIESYATRSTGETLGAQAVAPEHEIKIKALAARMGITHPIMVRKMNHAALRAFGYHNAFAYFPCLLTCIPLSSTPYLYISEGFFEDLSPIEQEFIIGHELVHIKYEHVRYLNLSTLALTLLLLFICYLFKKNITSLVQVSVPSPFQKRALIAIWILLIVSSGTIPEIIELAYRRHIEKVADLESLSTLHTYQGCLQLMARWQKEFRLPHDNPWAGFFTDHPSCNERKTYCLELQKHNQKDIA